MAWQGRILGLALLFDLQGLSARSVRGSRFLGSQGLKAGAPAPAVSLTAADCSSFSQAFLLSPQPSCELFEYDNNGLAGCKCKLPVPPAIRLADVGSSGHADAQDAEPTTLTCPFAACADGTSAEASSCLALKSFGFSKVEESSLSAEDTYRGTHSCSYLMEPGHVFAMPAEVESFRYITESQNQALNINCGGTDGLKTSTTMKDVCRRAIYRYKVTCDETWASMLPVGCGNATAPFGFTSESTVAELCAMECSKPGEFDVKSLASKLKVNAENKAEAEEKERQAAKEKARLEAQKDAKLKQDALNEATAAGVLGPDGAAALASTPGLATAIVNNPAFAEVLKTHPKLSKVLSDYPNLAAVIANDPAVQQVLVDYATTPATAFIQASRRQRADLASALSDVPGFAAALDANTGLATAMATTAGFAEALATDRKSVV